MTQETTTKDIVLVAAARPPLDPAKRKATWGPPGANIGTELRRPSGPSATGVPADGPSRLRT